MILLIMALPIFARVNEPANPAVAQRVESLDGLHGILASSVAVHHLVTAGKFHFDRVSGWLPSGFHNQLGEVSVSILFMVTGYLFWRRLVALRCQIGKRTCQMEQCPLQDTNSKAKTASRSPLRRRSVFLHFQLCHHRQPVAVARQQSVVWFRGICNSVLVQARLAHTAFGMGLNARPVGSEYCVQPHRLP
ncbi:hypothetical protein ACVCH0_20595 [Burkholderia glumae]